MDLLNVNRQSASRIQSTRTHFTFEVLRLLMLHEHYFHLKNEYMVSVSLWIPIDLFHLQTLVRSTNTMGEILIYL
jgi:hypothetical protein